MAVSFYMDHHVPRSITVGLRLKGLDIVTAFDDNAHELNDSQLMDRAGEFGRVLFTQDDDLLARQQSDSETVLSLAEWSLLTSFVSP